MLSSRLYLPANTRTKQLFEVLLRIMDNPFHIQGREVPTINESSGLTSYAIVTSKEFNVNLASSENNFWIMKAVPDESIKISAHNLHNTSYQDVTQYYMTVKDKSGNFYIMKYDTDSSDDTYEYANKVLTFYNTAIGFAIGKKLVDFFEGKMFFLESNLDGINDSYSVASLNATYRPQNFSSEERMFHYYNCLHQLKPIMVEDIKSMQKRRNYDDNEKLIEFLRADELSRKMEQDLPLKNQRFNQKKI